MSNLQNNNPTRQPAEYDDEITLKELILKIQEYWGVLWAKKWWIIGIASIVGVLFGLKSYFEDTIYPAEITFMVNEDSGSGGGGGAAAILGQFGFGGGSSEYNLDKIVALSRSQHIISQALLDTSYQPLLANRVIEVYDLHGKWEEDTLISNYFFTEERSGLAHQKALRSVCAKVKGATDVEGIMNIGYTEETGILSLKVNSISENLAIDLTRSIYDKLSTFYIKEQTEKPKQNFQLLSERADSVYSELTNVQNRIAVLEDRSNALLLRQDRTVFERLKREAQVLGVMYGEVVKNKETAHFILKSETPFFQVIDQTELPIIAVKESLIKQLVIGGFLGGFLTVLFLIAQYIYRETMSS